MKVIKKLNNSAALCLDNDGNELIAFGKGIGFGKIPYELQDLSIIQSTFYNIDERYFNLINSIDFAYFDIAGKIVDCAKRKLDYTLGNNVMFSLADHIQFAVKRNREGVDMCFALTDDLKQQYRTECAIGEYALKLIHRNLGIQLQENEKYSIALLFINYKTTESRDRKKQKKIIADVTEIVERKYGITIDRDGFNYSRFVSHIRHLTKRIDGKQLFTTENVALYQEVAAEFPKTLECAMEISALFERQMYCRLGDEELLYLMLHINRLCMREQQ